MINSYEINKRTGKVKKMVGHYQNPKAVFDALLTDQQTVVVRGFDALRVGDFEAFLNLLSDDVVFNILNYEYVYAGLKVSCTWLCISHYIDA